MIATCTGQRFSRIEAMRREALDAAARRGHALTDVVERGVRLELAKALRITEHAAADLMAMAETLVHRYPTVLALLTRAGITERHTRILVTALDELEPAQREALLPELLELAEAHPVGTFRRALRRLVDAARAETLAQRHEEALARRRLVVEPADDGMAWLHVCGPAVEVQAVHARVTAMGKAIVAHDGEERTLDQVRTDVLFDLLIEGETDLHPANARGIRATVAVTVPVMTLLAETDEQRAAATSAPAVVEGIGPIPLDRARELCGGDESWMRVLTHPETGAVLSVGRDQYRPPASLRRLVRWRADRCMAPGCGIPASRCEIDHTVAWEDGGTTALDNLAPLCRGHHKVKHHGGWKVEQVPDSGGALAWTSPSGRRYVVEPERRVPVFRPSHTRDAPF